MPYATLKPLGDRLSEVLNLRCDRGRRRKVVLLVEEHGVEGHRVLVELPRQHEVHIELQEGTGLGGR